MLTKLIQLFSYFCHSYLPPPLRPHLSIYRPLLVMLLLQIRPLLGLMSWRRIDELPVSAPLSSALRSHHCLWVTPPHAAKTRSEKNTGRPVTLTLDLITCVWHWPVLNNQLWHGHACTDYRCKNHRDKYNNDLFNITMILLVIGLHWWRTSQWNFTG